MEQHTNDEMPHYVVVLSPEESKDELEEDGRWSEERGDTRLHANLRAGKGQTLILAVITLRGPSGRIRIAARRRVPGEAVTGAIGKSDGDDERAAALLLQRATVVT
ncbi:hypothetical protein Tco_1503314 [Tanacetum coccineum]